jgi:hypothetical protein
MEALRALAPTQTFPLESYLEKTPKFLYLKEKETINIFSL